MLRTNTRPPSGAAVFGGILMDLSRRRTIKIELPEFLLRSLLQRVAESNIEAEANERVQLNDVIEWYLAALITAQDIPKLEAAIPGFTDALSGWLNTVSYDPQ
jgi:hypothetical protein